VHIFVAFFYNKFHVFFLFLFIRCTMSSSNYFLYL
jgi:hypothetical protein